MKRSAPGRQALVRTRARRAARTYSTSRPRSTTSRRCRSCSRRSQPGRGGVGGSGARRAARSLREERSSPASTTRGMRSSHSQQVQADRLARLDRVRAAHVPALGERSRLRFELIDATQDEEAGLKSATFPCGRRVRVLQAERGSIALCASRRSTRPTARPVSRGRLSPAVTDDADVEIEDKDLRIDTCRAQAQAAST